MSVHSDISIEDDDTRNREYSPYIIYQETDEVTEDVRTFLRYFSNWEEIIHDTMLHTHAIIIHCNEANLTEIPEEIGKFRALKEFNCSNNNLMVLPETLSELENLEELNILNNKILILPDQIGRLKKLKRIDAAYNMLDILPLSFADLEGLRHANFVHNNFKYMPPPLMKLASLESLYMAENYMKTIPPEIDQMVALRTLHISENRIWKCLPVELGNLVNLKLLNLENNCIAELPSTIGNLVNMEELHLNYNQILVIPPSIGHCAALRYIKVSHNLLRTIPVEIIQCTKLDYIERSDNELDLHPAIQRFLDNRRNINMHGGLYRDSQNVHTSSIQESIKNSIFNLLNDPYSATKEAVIQEVIGCPHISKKELIIEYINDDNETHSTLYCTFFDAFMKVWGRITAYKANDHRSEENNNEGVRQELFKRLNEELSEGECKCFTGRLSRIVNVLNGFFDDIQVHISSNEQIANVILAIRAKHGLGPDDVMSETLKETIRKELGERGYKADIIELWLV